MKILDPNISFPTCEDFPFATNNRKSNKQELLIDFTFQYLLVK